MKSISSVMGPVIPVRPRVGNTANDSKPESNVLASPISSQTMPDVHFSGSLPKTIGGLTTLAALGLTVASGPWNSAEAAITPESEKLVKILESTKDEELVAAALVNLAAVNERDVIPFVKTILEKGTAEEHTLKAALKAAGQLGAKSPAAEKAKFIKMIRPYLQNVVLVEKDKSCRFMTLSAAEAEVEEEPTSKIKDMRYTAARALGLTSDPALQADLVRAVQNSALKDEVRLLSLEALKYAPASGDLDKELMTFFEKLNQEDQKDLAAQTAAVLIRHQSKDFDSKVEKLFTPKAPAATPAATTTPAKTADAPKGESTIAKGFGFVFGGGSTPAPGTMPTTFQKQVLIEMLEAKRPEHAGVMLKQLASFPAYFKEEGFPYAVEFFQAMPAASQKQLLGLIDSRETEKAVREMNPKKSSYSDVKEEKADEAKIIEKIGQHRKLALTLAVALKPADSGPVFRQIFNNSLESMSLRHLAVAGSAALKDEAAVGDLMALTTDNTENEDLRFDAISAVMDIGTLPLAQGLKSDRGKVELLKRYNNIFSGNEKFTQSIYKAEIFSEIRDARKALLGVNAPLKSIDEATQRIVERRVQQLTTGTERRQKLMNSKAFKEHEAKLVEYVKTNPRADGFLRIMVIGALGESKNEDVKEALKDLIKDPMVRTKVPELATSNDMLMPGHTRQMVANGTRQASIQALGRVGGLNDTELLEKGLWDDNRRMHLVSLKAMADIGKNTAALKDEKSIARRKELSDMLIKRMPAVNLHATERMNNYFMNMYARAADRMGGGEKLLALMDKTDNTVLKRAIANGLIYNGSQLDNPKVTQHLLSISMGVDALHKKGIDGRGVEIAIIDGDYINNDVEGMKGKIVYPDWGRIDDASLRESYHGETVASVIVGKKANLTYGVAPGLSKIYSYAAWDDKVNPSKHDPLEEVDGLMRSLDHIISQRIAGKTKVSIVNISLGGSSARFYSDDAVKERLNKIAARFKAGSQAGITFVVSAGNEGGSATRHHLIGTMNSLGYNRENGKLVQSNGVILVAAMDNQGTTDRSKHTISGFSSGGDVYNATRPDISALGSYLPLLDREDNGDLVMDEADGTSFASPLVAGGLVLMQQAHGSPLETEQVRQILGKTAYKLENTPEFRQGPGGFDIPRAVDSVTDRRMQRELGAFMRSLGGYLNQKAPDPKAAPPVNK